jgi:hypothetical protein
VSVLLVAFASGYGYHRDELYFIAAGQHLDWAYADQGPVTPLIARAMTEISAESLTVLRLPSAIAAGLVVFLTGLLVRELGGTRRAELIAAGCAAVGVIVLFTGHLLSTSSFDLLAWTAVTWLVVRALRTGDDRLWLVAGLVLGLGLLNKPLPAFLAVGLLAGVAIAGPRHLIRNRYVWGGAAIAFALWLPWIVWQADNDWPQIDVSREIAAGGSASSEPWWAVVPFQFLLISPMLAPVWIAGLVAFFRDPALRSYRFFAWAWVVLAVVYMAVGGKPYYLAGLLPVLLAAGAVKVDVWLERGNATARKAVLVSAIGLSALIGGTISLPVLPASDSDLVVAANSDVGEMIGWPDLVDTVSGVDRGLPDSAVILTGNYGEAGAIERFGPERGLPQPYSGHNAYADWGPPPAAGAPVITVGLTPAEMDAHLHGCRVVARIDNDEGIENDEQGEPVMICDGPRGSWAEQWPGMRHLG